jgi:hypothetical protein
MKIINLSNSKIDQLTDKLNKELKLDILVVNISIFYSRIDEKHHAVICCFE